MDAQENFSMEALLNLKYYFGSTLSSIFVSLFGHHLFGYTVRMTSILYIGSSVLILSAISFLLRDHRLLNTLC